MFFFIAQHISSTTHCSSGIVPLKACSDHTSCNTHHDTVQAWHMHTAVAHLSIATSLNFRLCLSMHACLYILTATQLAPEHQGISVWFLNIAECLQCRSSLSNTCSKGLKVLWQTVPKLNDIQKDLPMYSAVGAEEYILKEQVEDGSINLLKMLMMPEKLEALSL